MGYSFTIKDYYQVRKEAEYPAPCPSDRKRKYLLFTDDVLTKNNNGTFTVHTGLCLTGIKLKPHQVKKIKGEIALRLM